MARTTASPETRSENGPRDIAWRPIYSAVLSFVSSGLRRIRAGFASNRNRSSVEITPTLDIAQTAEYLRVADRAQEDGRRNLPPPDEETPAGTQREIISHFSNLRRRARQQAADAVERVNRALEQIRDSDDLARVRDMPAAFESKVLRYLADFESRLQHCIERERNQKQYYETYRKENSLNRVASYPDVAYLYYLVVPLLIAVMAYTLASPLVSGAGGSSGISLSWRIMSSAVTIVVPFTLGMISLRATKHVSNFRKLAGWVGVIVTVAVTFAIARCADFHSAAVLANPKASNLAAFESLLRSPLDLASGIESWTTFGTFVLFGLVSMFLGYRADDAYPGYGAVQRSYYRTRKERENLSSRLRKRINAFADEAAAEVAGIVRRYKSDARNYTSMVRTSAQIPSLLNDYDVDLEDACNIVLDRYRAANVAVRDSEAPVSFAEHVCFNAEGPLPFGSQSDSRTDATEVEDSIIELEKETALALQKLRALHLQLISSVTESQFPDTESSA